MNYYTCNDNSISTDEIGVWAIIRAKTLLRAKRLFLTKTDARETYYYNPESLKGFSVVKLDDKYAELFDKASENKNQQAVLNFWFEPYQDIYRDLGWQSENSVSCDCCGLHDLGKEHEGTYISTDDSDSVCKDCNK